MKEAWVSKYRRRRKTHAYAEITRAYEPKRNADVHLHQTLVLKNARICKKQLRRIVQLDLCVVFDITRSSQNSSFCRNNMRIGKKKNPDAHLHQTLVLKNARIRKKQLPQIMQFDICVVFDLTRSSQSSSFCRNKMRIGKKKNADARLHQALGLKTTRKRRQK